MTQLYDQSWFAHQASGSARSANIIAPAIVEEFSPTSVVDVGTGIGTWAAAFLAHGVSKVIGIDGDYVERSMLMIPSENFIPLDLNEVRAGDISESFDIAVCLEVAEHLDPDNNDRLVEFLCSLAPTVVFGAAIPEQGGTGHINERPQSYWASQFSRRGYSAMDLIRPKFWNADVQYWYVQNTLVYTKQSVPLGRRPAILDIAHPSAYSRRMKKLRRARRELRHERATHPRTFLQYIKAALKGPRKEE